MFGWEESYSPIIRSVAMVEESERRARKMRFDLNLLEIGSNW